MKLEKISEDSFKLIEGCAEDFELIQKWWKFYNDHITKKTFSIEEMDQIVTLISRVIDGPEQGMYTVSKCREDGLKLAKLLKQNGYKPWGIWTEP